MNKRENLETVRAWALDYIEGHPIPDFTVGSAADTYLQRWFVVPWKEVANV